MFLQQTDVKQIICMVNMFFWVIKNIALAKEKCAYLFNSFLDQLNLGLDFTKTN